ncbi:hypothetical protein B9Z65_391 [Elsinoe australis]|uniref:Class II aldolase/adducin N-terminal domain-containing protein n=1 Tax=Elsinoe australis TaxID=40998 RepID=A0A2P7ZQF0_9PEZI|nr:hypothetical protein B9Z65_391 [Elsinoe australis]
MPDDLSTRLKTATTPIPPTFFSTLITANHILHSQSIVDGYGHISSRSPQDPTIFYLSASLAPALVSTRSDILAYRVSDGSPVPTSSLPPGHPSPDDRKHYLERFIHSELYKRYPDVHAVVHAHSEPVLPFSITSVPLRPVFHMAGVMSPSQVPVFDIGAHYNSSDGKHDLLVTNAHLGAALAAGFQPEGWVSKTGSFVRSFVERQVGMGKGEDEGVKYPPYSVVLMRGHGFTAVGTGVEEAVYRAIYTVVNARVQKDAVLLQGAWNTGVVGERVSKVGKEGYAGQEKDGTKLEGVRFLSEREGKEAWESNKGQVMRPWGLWVEEVKRAGFYKNEYWEKEKEGKTQG